MHRKLTIGIPTYNRSTVIKKNIENILSSDLNVDLVVSDNGSDDDTWAVLSEFVDDRLTINRNESNLGFTANMLKLIELTKTDFIFFISDEDVINPASLKRIIKKLETSSDVGVVYTSVAKENGYIYNYITSEINYKKLAVTDYAFSHGYMSGMIVNISYLDIYAFSHAVKDEKIILYPHELFFILIMNSGAKLLLIEDVSCSQGVAEESATYNVYQYDRYDKRAELISLYIRVVERLDISSDYRKDVFNSLGRYSADVFYSNLLSERLRGTGFFIYLVSMFKSKISIFFIKHLIKKLIFKFKKIVGDKH